MPHRPCKIYSLQPQRHFKVHWKLDSVDTDLVETLGLKDTLQKIWAPIFDFEYISLLKIAENLGLADKRLVTYFPLKRAFTVSVY